AVAVDEALAFRLAVRPRGDLAAHARLGQREQRLVRIEHGVAAVALHQFLKAPLAQAVGARLAAQIADHELRRAAGGAEELFDVAARFAAPDVVDRGVIQDLLKELARLAPPATPHLPAAGAPVRPVAG